MPHDRPAKRRKNFAVIFAANAVYAGAQLLMLVAITRWTTLAETGFYGFGLALTTPIMLATGMALREVAFTDAAHSHLADSYVRLRHITTSIALGLCLALGAAVAASREEFTAIAAVAIVKAIESLCEMRYGLWQRDGNHSAVARSLALRAVVGLCAFVIVLRFTRIVPLALLATSLVWAIVYQWFDGFHVASEPGARATVDRADGPLSSSSREGVRALAALAWPMGIVAAIVSLQINLPRGFVRAYLGTEALGRFTAISAVLAISSTVLVALGQTNGPRLAQLWLERSYRAFANLTARLIAMMLAIAGVGVALALSVGDLVIPLAFGGKYHGLETLLAQMCLAAGLFGISGILGTAALALRTFRLVSLLQVASALLTTLACWLFVPHGLIAAGWAVVLAAAVSSLPPLGAFVYARRSMREAAR
ncbi:MAG: lipopolysaccharide biosynthesis protein [Myxococcales bacterium]|nr:lipopolysaccharide biosynthesis protein [Myxococcales bacterium]